MGGDLKKPIFARALCFSLGLVLCLGLFSGCFRTTTGKSISKKVGLFQTEEQRLSFCTDVRSDLPWIEGSSGEEMSEVDYPVVPVNPGVDGGSEGSEPPTGGPDPRDDSMVIASLPMVINQPGNYHLESDITAASGITVTADNVFIDGRNHLVTITSPSILVDVEGANSVEAHRFRVNYTNIGGSKMVKVFNSQNVKFSNFKGFGPGFNINAAQDIEIYEFEVVGTGIVSNSGMNLGLVSSTGGCRRCTVKNSIFDLQGDFEQIFIVTGRRADAPDSVLNTYDVLIEGNTLRFRGSAGQFIQTYYARNVTFRNNRIENFISGAESTLRDSSQNFIFEGNIIESEGDGLWVGKGNADFWKKPFGFVFRNNIIRVKETGGGALRLYSGAYDIEVSGNLIVSEGGGGTIHLGGADDNHKIVNNTIVNLGTGSNLFFDSEHQSKNISVQNNILYSNSGILVQTAGRNWRNDVTMNYNLYHQSNPGAPVLASFDGSSYSSLNAFKNGTGYEANGLEADPLFITPTGYLGNYDLRSGSPAINRGLSSLVNWEKDILNRSRIQAGVVDVGAFEFGTEVAPTAQPATQQKVIHIYEGDIAEFDIEISDLMGAGPYQLEVLGRPYYGEFTVSNPEVQNNAEEKKFKASFQSDFSRSDEPYTVAVTYSITDGALHTETKFIKFHVYPRTMSVSDICAEGWIQDPQPQTE